MNTAKRPGGPLQQRTSVKLVNGKTVTTKTLFTDIVNDLRNVTIHCTDEHGNEYEAFHLTIDVNRNLKANSWFQI
jgi:hypothetical protein